MTSAGETGGAPDTPLPKGPGGTHRPPAPTRREAVDGVGRELAEAGIENARGEAERLLCHALGIDRTELARSGREDLAPRQAVALARLVGRRVSGEPLQHIEGTVQFRDLVLLADPRAFIPRPETEQLVDWIGEWAEARGRTPASGVKSVGRPDSPSRRPGRGVEGGSPPLDTALDIGTGSGAIALCLVAEGISHGAVGIDISAEALVQAAANREGAGIEEDRVEFRLADGPLWTSVSGRERFDLIVSNPPYVTDAELDRLPREIREREPRAALAGGADGLDLVREIAAGGSAYLEPGGALFLEIGETQAEAVGKVLAGEGWDGVEVRPDLAGRDRFVRAEPA